MRSTDPDDPEELEEVERVLARAAGERRAILEAARREADDEDARRMERALDEAARRSARTRIGWRVGRWGLAAAAVAAGLLLWLALGRDEPTSDPGEGPSGILLGRPELRLVSPVGEVQAYGILRWDLSAADAAAFTIRVMDPESRETLLEQRVAGSQSLAPDSSDSASWPARIEVEVTALDEAGEPLATCSGSAWLVP